MKLNAWIKNIQIATLASGCLLFSLAYGATTHPTAKPDPYHLKPAPNTVTLTFDDGPDPKYTEEVLAVLDKYHVKATFFVLGGNAKAYPKLIKEMIAHGHNVENHSMTHPKLSHLTAAQINQQIAGTNQIIKDLTGRSPVCLRPPYGMHNKLVDQIAHQNGLQVINWDWNSFDYERRGSEAIFKEVTTHAKSGFVILMHDGGPRQQTVDALPKIIEYYRSKGIGFSQICYTSP